MRLLYARAKHFSAIVIKKSLQIEMRDRQWEIDFEHTFLLLLSQRNAI
jgi:hypothetical protein